MHRVIILLSFLVLWSAPILGQHAEHEEVSHAAEHEFRHFRVAPLIGHTFVPAGHMSDHLAIPSWGLDLEYWFNEKLGFGFHNDIEIQSFIIEQEGGEELLERDYPLVLTFDLLYRPWRGLVLLAGPGYELEKTENLFVFRMGVEYEIELDHHWDLSPAFFYDTREQVYDTWSVALGVGYRFNVGKP